MTITDSHKEKPMIQTEIVTITPERAKELLGGNTKNRKVKQRIVEMYADDMRAGNWNITGEAIVVNGGDTLLNGQHRLLACIKAGVPFETLLVTGVEQAAQEAMDQGTRRSISDVLCMRGESVTTMLAATLTATHRYRHGLYGGNVSVPVVLEMLESEPYAREVVRVVMSRKLQGSPLKWRISVSGVLGMEAYRTGSGDFEQFCRVLSKPDAVGSQHPIYLLRERLIGWSTSMHANVSSQMMLAMTIKAWNAWVTGERPKKLVWRAASDSFPSIINGEGVVVSRFGELSAGFAHGSDHPNAKLTECDVLSIRDQWSTGVSQTYLAEKYGVNRSIISGIVNKKAWRHVK